MSLKSGTWVIKGQKMYKQPKSSIIRWATCEPKGSVSKDNIKETSHHGSPQLQTRRRRQAIDAQAQEGVLRMETEVRISRSHAGQGGTSILAQTRRGGWSLTKPRCGAAMMDAWVV